MTETLTCPKCKIVHEVEAGSKAILNSLAESGDNHPSFYLCDSCNKKREAVIFDHDFYNKE